MDTNKKAKERPFRRRPTCVCGRKRWRQWIDGNSGKKHLECKSCGVIIDVLWEYVPRPGAEPTVDKKLVKSATDKLYQASRLIIEAGDHLEDAYPEAESYFKGRLSGLVHAAVRTTLIVVEETLADLDDPQGGDTNEDRLRTNGEGSTTGTSDENHELSSS